MWDVGYKAGYEYEMRTPSMVGLRVSGISDER